MGSAPLAGYTTLGLGGPAATLTEADGEAGLVSAVRRADERGEPVLVLGGGSNVVIADEGFPRPGRPRRHPRDVLRPR